METYTLLKLLHILAVLLFMGNIYTGLFWMYKAHQTKDPAIIHHTMKTIIVSDNYFTIPGVIIITVGGIAAAMSGHHPLLGTGWIFYSIVLFSLSGIAFVWKVAPLQKKIVKCTVKDQFNGDEYQRLYRQWDIWGLFAILTPLAALVMMVLKAPVDSFLAK